VRHPRAVVGYEVAEGQLAELAALFAATWWAGDRGVDDARRVVAGSDLVVTVTGDGGRLVGFARVLTDFAYVALILDVVVAEAARGTGVGATLMDAVVGHPRLAGVRSLELVCQPELEPFYARWGFTARVGGSRLMRRTSDPTLRG
jgi:GNAT superfamily N-acetyltransferase